MILSSWEVWQPIIFVQKEFYHIPLYLGILDLKKFSHLQKTFALGFTILFQFHPLIYWSHTVMFQLEQVGEVEDCV